MSKKAKKKFKLENKNAQYFYEEMMKVSPSVSAVLKKDLPSRDDDNRLLFKIWKKYGAKDTSSRRSAGVARCFRKNIPIFGGLYTNSVTMPKLKYVTK